jgi:glucosamine 6-phosphate synthetase-like amidotransferase/phosphosugar isomerase protein
MSNSDQSNPMRDQVFSVPDLIREQIWLLEGRTRKIITTPEIYGTRRIVLTGSGDSFIGGMAAENAFIELAGIHTQALNAMQASRYDARDSQQQYPRNPLVLAVSNSGEVARVVEAVQHYTEQGALTVAITGNTESRLAIQAQRVIQLNIPPFTAAPGVRSYIVSLLALYLLAIRFGEVRNKYTMDEAMALRRELEAAADAVTVMIASLDEPLQKLAKEWSQFSNFELLGSGPDRSTAAYGAAKLLEAAGVHAIHQDIEEWVHLQYFVRDSHHTATFVICPENAGAFSRVLEIESLLKRLERPYQVLTAESCSRQFKNVLSVPAAVRPIFVPLVYSPILAFFAG